MWRWKWESVKFESFLFCSLLKTSASSFVLVICFDYFFITERTETWKKHTEKYFLCLILYFSSNNWILDEMLRRNTLFVNSSFKFLQKFNQSFNKVQRKLRCEPEPWHILSPDLDLAGDRIYKIKMYSSFVRCRLHFLWVKTVGFLINHCGGTTGNIFEFCPILSMNSISDKCRSSLTCYSKHETKCSKLSFYIIVLYNIAWFSL